MDFPSTRPVRNAQALRGRIDGFFAHHFSAPSTGKEPFQSAQFPFNAEGNGNEAREDVGCFLDRLSQAVEVYLFGGFIRDLALCGRRHYRSDIDLVMDGPCSNVISLLSEHPVNKNRYGGFRLQVNKWSLDVWQATDTWAVRQGLVPYEGIGSLTKTTVLNWDAILMNWHTKRFVHMPGYFEAVRQQSLDIVLSENPNPLGMMVRVLRQLYLKRGVPTIKAAKYLADAAFEFAYKDVNEYELSSYGQAIIPENLHAFFALLDVTDEQSMAALLKSKLPTKQGGMPDYFSGQRSMRLAP